MLAKRAIRRPNARSEAEVEDFLNQWVDNVSVDERKARLTFLEAWIKAKKRTITADRPGPRNAARGRGRGRIGGTRGGRQRGGRGDAAGGVGNGRNQDDDDAESAEESVVGDEGEGSGTDQELDFAGSGQDDDEGDGGDGSDVDQNDDSTPRGGDGDEVDGGGNDVDQEEDAAGIGGDSEMDDEEEEGNGKGQEDVAAESSGDSSEDVGGKGSRTEDDDTSPRGGESDKGDREIESRPGDQKGNTRKVTIEDDDEEEMGRDLKDDEAGKKEQPSPRHRTQRRQHMVWDQQQEALRKQQILREQQRARMQQDARLRTQGQQAEAQDRRREQNGQEQGRTQLEEDQGRSSLPKEAEEEGSDSVQTRDSDEQQARGTNDSLSLTVNNNGPVDPTTPNRPAGTTAPSTGPFPTPQSIPRPHPPGFAKESPAQIRAMDLLVQAASLPDLPDNPLRLTADSVNKASLEQTRDEIFKLPGISRLDPSKKQDQRKREAIIKFVGSLFSPATYWALNQTMWKVVTTMGISKFDSVDDSSIQLNSKDSPTRDYGNLPACLKTYVDSWNENHKFSSQTITSGVTTMVKMRNEMQCYVHWLRLLATWDPTHQDGGDGVPDDKDGFDSTNTRQLRDEVEISPKATEELKIFFENKFNKPRGVSLSASGNAGASRATELKALVAPYLGLSTSMYTSGDHNRGAQDVTRKTFNKMWNNTMVRGKTSYILCQHLGRGALVVTQRTTPLYDIVWNIFLGPILSSRRLKSQDIDYFIRLTSEAHLVKECNKHEEGLRAIFTAKGKVADVGALAVEGGGRVDNAGEDDGDNVFDKEDILNQDTKVVVEGQGFPTPPPSSRKRAADTPTATAGSSGVGRGSKRRG
ncbi:MAG: hypothetical protein Q9225_006687 [Loekoesia sp. 1 TL-2023]